VAKKSKVDASKLKYQYTIVILDRVINGNKDLEGEVPSDSSSNNPNHSNELEQQVDPVMEPKPEPQTPAAVEAAVESKEQEATSEPQVELDKHFEPETPAQPNEEVMIIDVGVEHLESDSEIERER
jgi:hypothetical protein